MNETPFEIIKRKIFVCFEFGATFMTILLYGQEEALSKWR
jgi:hypothetical protein